VLVTVLSHFFSIKKILRVLKRFHLEAIFRNVYSVSLKDITGKLQEVVLISYGKKDGVFLNEEIACKRLVEDEAPSKPCLFGEKQLKASKKPVGIVKRYISAIIMSLFNPNVIWLATGDGEDAYNLESDRTIKFLKNRQVTLFPCLGEYDEAIRVANNLKSNGLDIGVDSLFRDDRDELRFIFPQGVDIADYILDQMMRDEYFDSMI
jgi:hypothetical protein